MPSERTANVQRCQRCQGSLRAETAVDLQTGVVILQYVCFNCGRRWYPEKAPRPMTAASSSSSHTRILLALISSRSLTYKSVDKRRRSSTLYKVANESLDDRLRFRRYNLR